MKFYLLISALFFCSVTLPAQDDTLYYEADTTPPLPPLSFRLQALSASYLDGRVQFFDGYNQEVLYADARSGLPLYSDWRVYSGSSLLPDYFQFALNAGFTDTIRGLRLRMGLQYSARRDTFAYSGGYLNSDTVLGRLGNESGAFGGFSVAILKQSRTLLKFLRLHGGAELEVGISPTSRIRATEYAYDIGDEEMLDYNVFVSSGKPRMNVFLNAVVGLETVFAKHFGFVAEVRSGLGTQVVVKQKAFGMARTAYMLGIQYYLWDHRRRALPRIPHLMEVEPDLPPAE